jgi:hypothetical protein
VIPTACPRGTLPSAGPAACLHLCCTSPAACCFCLLPGVCCLLLAASSLPFCFYAVSCLLSHVCLLLPAFSCCGKRHIITLVHLPCCLLLESACKFFFFIRSLPQFLCPPTQQVCTPCSICSDLFALRQHVDVAPCMPFFLLSNSSNLYYTTFPFLSTRPSLPSPPSALCYMATLISLQHPPYVGPTGEQTATVT